MSDAKQLLDEVLKMNNPLIVKSWLEHYFRTHGLADMVKSNRMLNA